ncbi:pyruvate dehydrogenase complex dihydrolipoamide acetyltransferase [Parvibaculaceae bacterium PLY_AMNH_Bact1]|nr:pyruvate dehydrogenase complex dihydrolipoamide acetyltransferase [Parvibaculaceae bacterium PLY_AMNH_Bact1]
MPIPILMPALSPTMEEGTLAKWLVKEGDEVRSGDLIAEIETDKATMEVEAVDEGTVGKLLVAEGTEGVPVNETIAVILEEGEDASAAENVRAPTPAPTAPTEAAAEAEPEKAAVPMTEKAEPADGRIFASPLAKRIAKDKGIDLTAVTGSGPRGRIVKADIEAAPKTPARASGKAQAPISSVDARAFYEAGTYDEIPLNSMRKTIARRLTQSKQEIPHYYLTIDCVLDELLKVRKHLNTEGADAGVKLSVNDFVVRAAALALKKVPEANVSFADDALLQHHHSDVGIAVALEGGLITPIIRRADEKGLAEISAEAKELAARARDKKLSPAEFEGGSFSVSNLGMFGVKNFTAVINPPQAAIMAVGTGEPRPIIVDDEVKAATVMTVTLSCDHRAIDGALGAQLLAAFKSYIEYPPSMLL